MSQSFGDETRTRLTATAVALVSALLAVFALAGAPAAQAQPAGKDFSKPAIVILGYGLTPDGWMRPILFTRVLTGLAVAQAFPQSPIIVTGGNPRQGRTEAGEMRNLLQMLGFPANRIIVEDKANSTVQNARFSVPLAKKADTSGIILVTSSTHQDRADTNFVDAGANVLATVSFPDGDPATNIGQFVKDVLSPVMAIR
ncbi:YdcF family protein [Mycolicibacterium neoaurum]|uniref:YdcF family protein n=1 Tax=Mycolicibacterium neoaurum TaxID=1795 RepID=UPI00248B07C0|nr:YdcF family protein [Mycolicibacterium neoaurum]WBP95237.1 YdcF family protein [Mycolicibacterium neoaurum]WBS08465.1 YdcF family protein [Mycolicibacterium neoaurum]